MSLAGSTAWAAVVLACTAALTLLAVLPLSHRAAKLTWLLGKWTLLPACALLLVAGLHALPRPAPEWAGDFSTEDLSQWAETHAAWPGGVRVVDDPVRPGYQRAALFTVRPGDRTFGQLGEERSEIMAGPRDSGAFEGNERWYAWSFLLPEPVTSTTGGFLSLTQWHQSGDRCPPNVALVAPTSGEEARLRLLVRGGALDVTTCRASRTDTFDLGPLPVGHWADVEVRAMWSADPSLGTLSVRVDGRLALPETRLANLYTGQFAYLKQGLYRSNSSQTDVMYVTATVVGRAATTVYLPGCLGTGPAHLLSHRRAWC